MTVVLCLVGILFFGVGVCVAFAGMYDAVRIPLILRYGKKFRIVKTKKLTRDSWRETDSLEEQYRLEVCTLGIWMMYDWWKDARVCEQDIEEIKKWRELRQKEKEAKKNKEVIKEDVL